MFADQGTLHEMRGPSLPPRKIGAKAHRTQPSKQARLTHRALLPVRGALTRPSHYRIDGPCLKLVQRNCLELRSVSSGGAIQMGGIMARIFVAHVYCEESPSPPIPNSETDHALGGLLPGAPKAKLRPW